MKTRQRTLGELHDHLAVLGYSFESLFQVEVGGVVGVKWGASVPDASITADIDAYVWDFEYETTDEALTRLGTELATKQDRVI